MKKIKLLLLPVLIIISLNVFAQGEEDTVAKKKSLSISLISELNYTNGTKLFFKNKWNENSGVAVSYGTIINKVLCKHFSLGTGFIYDKYTLDNYLKFNYILIGVPIIPDFYYSWEKVSLHFIPEIRTDYLIKYDYSVNHNNVNIGTAFFKNKILLLGSPKFGFERKISNAFSASAYLGIKQTLIPFSTKYYYPPPSHVYLYSLSGGLGINYNLHYKPKSKIIKDSIREQKGSMFSISINYGISYCYRITNGDYNSFNWYYTNTPYAFDYGSIIYPTKFETAKIGSCFNLKFENKLCKYFSISYGLFYQNIGYSAENLGTTFTSFFGGGEEGYTLGKPYTVLSSYQNLYFNYLYWGVFLMPKYNLYNNKGSSTWSFGAGIRMGIYNKIYAPDIDNGENGYETFEIDKNDDIKYNLRCSKLFPIISIERNFKIVNHISFVLGSDFLIMLKPETRSKNTQVEPTTFGYVESLTQIPPYYYTIQWPQMNTNGKAYLFSIELTGGIVFHL